MATRSFIGQPLGDDVNDTPMAGTAWLYDWSGLLNTDDGAPAQLAGYADKTVTIHGAFGVGGSVTIEGSNDNSNWFPCTDPQGNAITKTAGAIEAIAEGPRYLRPRVTAGDGTTNLRVMIVARGWRR